MQYEQQPPVIESDAVKEFWIRAPFGDTPAKQLAECWRRRALLGFLISYGLSKQYSKTYLGIAWLFIRPAIMIAGGVFVAGKMIGVSTAPIPLVLFSLASFAPYLLFQRGVLLGTRGFALYKSLITRFLFPRILAQLASISSAIIIFLLIFAVSLIALFYFAIMTDYKIDIGWHCLWVFYSILQLLLFIWGVCFFTAPLNAMAADTRLTLRYLITLAMIISPVFYPIQQLDENLREYMWFNPLACILELYRWGLFHQFEPSWWHVWLMSAFIPILFLSGCWFFARYEQKALDET